MVIATREPNPASAAALQLNRFRLVVAGDLTLDLDHDETQVPSAIVDGTGPRHPPKIVIHSSNRRRSEANFQAVPGSTSDDIETSTRANSYRPI